MILASTIRQKYLDFFASKNHAIIPSSPLVPENDPSVLFNTAGMQPLVPYLLGEPHPLGNRLADVQKCVRTGDIDDVGDNTHLTFFEMLGNWSLGDYFKSESIQMSWEFLTSPEWLALDPEMISVTVFEGDANAPRDEESAAIWKSLGMPSDRIAYLPAEDNWWAAGPTGPCGPDTEIFYWMGEGKPPAGSNVGSDPKKWMEIWNNVFMQYNRIDASTLVELPAKCVDTGMGIERVTTTLNHMKSVYETDLFAPVLAYISEMVGVHNYREKSARIIADHLRSAVHMISDGVVPKNIDQGYILRRLIRRAIREAYKMGYEQSFAANIAQMYIDQFSEIYSNVSIHRDRILTELTNEEQQFSKAIKHGLKEFEKITRLLIQERDDRIEGEFQGEKLSHLVSTPHSILSTIKKVISLGTTPETDEDTIVESAHTAGLQITGKQAFTLFDTYGFPLEMTMELAREQGFQVDSDGFAQAFLEHQEKSRNAAAGKFVGGLGDQSDETVALHSACHLMLAGLRKVLGNHVHQAGSNITSERLRFDFTHSEKMTDEQKSSVEAYVNEAINSGLTVEMGNMAKDEALASGVEGSFWEKYPEIVKVYSMVGSNGVTYSRELCGGPHVTHSQTMGKFRIQKEESSSAGVRRIKAVLVKE